MLAEISRQGFIRTMGTGDTGVGYTPKALLGIEANSKKTPDYKGIELKSSRTSKARNKHGKFNSGKGRDQLYHEISCT